ncbi:MAG: cob(I)yrinic acid a,c-diamide adenosyltransferase [Chitinophagales bacterium]
MKIYTKTGDIGETALYGGRRISKSDLRIEAYGTTDELNSWIGLLRDVAATDELKTLLKTIQDRLFTIGAALAADPENTKLPRPDLLESDVLELETAIDKMDESLPALRAFILPGGHIHISYCHLARTVSRRAERLVVALNHTSPVDPIILKYLNRLSDYLFTLARYFSHQLQVPEVEWHGRK